MPVQKRIQSGDGQGWSPWQYCTTCENIMPEDALQAPAFAGNTSYIYSTVTFYFKQQCIAVHTQSQPQRLAADKQQSTNLQGGQGSQADMLSQQTL